MRTRQYILRVQYSNKPAVILAACTLHAAVAHLGARSLPVIGQFGGSRSCGHKCQSQLDLIASIATGQVAWPWTLTERELEPPEIWPASVCYSS